MWQKLVPSLTKCVHTVLFHLHCLSVCLSQCSSSSCPLWSKHLKGSEERCWLGQNSLHSFRVLPFIKLQKTTLKQVCGTRTLTCFWLSCVVFMSSQNLSPLLHSDPPPPPPPPPDPPPARYYAQQRLKLKSGWEMGHHRIDHVWEESCLFDVC